MEENNNADVIETPVDDNGDVIKDDAAQENVADAKENEGDLLDKPGQDVAEEKAAKDVLADADVSEPEGLPDSYTFEEPEGGLPEGVEINEAQLDSYKDAAKEAGLTQDQFQKLMDFSVQQTQAATEEAVDAWNERLNGWKEAARTDKEFGGENYDANVRNALAAIDQFGDKEFKAILQSPSADNPEGLAIGNHPAVLRFLNRIGKRIGEPSFVQGDEGKAEMSDEARLARLYPSMQN